MHVCPVDCHWCGERQCAAEGCVLCSERVETVLTACNACGGLFVLTARIKTCHDCLRVDVLAQDTSGD